MDNKTWTWNLRQALTRPDGAVPHLAIVGVGQVLREDDAAGVAVVHRLQQLIQPDERLLLVDSGHAPENCLGPIIRFNPDIVLFVDAIRSAAAPGTILWFSENDIEETGGSSHTLSLGFLASYLATECGTAVNILCIQADSLMFGEGLSCQASDAVVSVAQTIAFYWRNAVAACSAMSTGEISVVNT